MITEKLHLPGNSNAKLEMEFDPNLGHIVKKTCNGKAGKRLLVQSEKQSNFRTNSTIRTPAIFRNEVESDRVTIVMEYVRGSDFVLFTNSATRDEFETSSKILVSMIKNEFLQGKISKFPTLLWIEKVNETLEKCLERSVFSAKENQRLKSFLLSEMPEEIILGECHGDITFSNVIVEKPDLLCVFDFLNPPIETPYEDAAKFLQDAQFFWSIMKHTGEFDRTRVKIYWTHAAEMLRNELKGICDFSLLKKFQTLGLLRIIPYTADDHVIHFLKNHVMNEVESDLSASLRRRIF